MRLGPKQDRVSARRWVTAAPFIFYALVLDATRAILKTADVWAYHWFTTATVTTGLNGDDQFCLPAVLRRDQLVAVESCKPPGDHLAGKRTLVLVRPELTPREKPGNLIFDLKALGIAHRKNRGSW